MDKHLGVFITLMNSHLHVSLNYALRVITHHVTHPMAHAWGVLVICLWGVRQMAEEHQKLRKN